MQLFIIATVVAVAVAGRLENVYLPAANAPGAGGSGHVLDAPFRSGGSPFGKISGPPTISNVYGVPATGVKNVIPAPAFGKFESTYSPSPFAPSPFSTAHVAPVHHAASPVHHGRVPSDVYGVSEGTYRSPGSLIGITRYESENNGEGSYHYAYETQNDIKVQEAGQPKQVGGEAPVAAQGFFGFISPEGKAFEVHYIADENGFQASGDHLPTPPPIPEAILKSLEQNALEEASGYFDNGEYKPSLKYEDSPQYQPTVQYQPAPQYQPLTKYQPASQYQNAQKYNGATHGAVTPSRQYLTPNQQISTSGYKY